MLKKFFSDTSSTKSSVSNPIAEDEKLLLFLIFLVANQADNQIKKLIYMPDSQTNEQKRVAAKLQELIKKYQNSVFKTEKEIINNLTDNSKVIYRLVFVPDAKSLSNAVKEAYANPNILKRELSFIPGLANKNDDYYQHCASFLIEIHNKFKTNTTALNEPPSPTNSTASFKPITLKLESSSLEALLLALSNSPGPGSTTSLGELPLEEDPAEPYAAFNKNWP